MRIYIQEENHSLTHFNIAHCAPFHVIRISRTVLNEWLFLSFPFQGPQKCQDTESIDTNRISIRNRCKIFSYKNRFCTLFLFFLFSAKSKCNSHPLFITVASIFTSPYAVVVVIVVGARFGKDMYCN